MSVVSIEGPQHVASWRRTAWSEGLPAGQKLSEARHVGQPLILRLAPQFGKSGFAGRIGEHADERAGPGVDPRLRGGIRLQLTPWISLSDHGPGRLPLLDGRLGP